jgi:hypothetical protein
VKDYRAALTRNLLSKVAPGTVEDTSSGPSPSNIPLGSSMLGRLPYTTVAQMAPSNVNDVLFKKLDHILIKVEEVSITTRRSIEELKEEISSRYEETRQQVDILENKVITLEKKFEDLAKGFYLIMKNVCTSLCDPQAVQGPDWKSYWQEQIKTLTECGASLSKPSS